ncbi:MAG TPA: P-II family nitrogen regulator, partial [Spirochaetota bacterium]|nr:P-II family nitrogen regulator [Spirochaetota bacterium]
MKLIVAMIQPHKLEDVKKALFDARITKMTVSTALGCGQQAGYKEEYRGAITEINLLKKIRLEIAVNDEYVK